MQASRSLSTSMSLELTHYNPTGQLYEFNVPRSTLNEWMASGKAVPLKDMHGTTRIITDEIRVLSPTSGQLNQFLVKP